jgi:predicted nucleotide-binding protein
VGYVVVLMTGDDVGRRVAEKPDKDQPRARQNVVLELGYFVGRLGRDRVAAILEHGVEKPSDWSGVVYIDFDAAGGWKNKLANELSAAGLAFDVYGLLGIQKPGSGA